MKDFRFPFDNRGIQQWRELLYASSEEVILHEQQMIAACTGRWLPLRFELDDAQIVYMQSLGETSLSQIGKDINEAINNRAVITMQHDRPQPGRDNSKVSTSTKSYMPILAEDQGDTLMSLDFLFYYTDNPI